jgi:membrane fusion protein (multidrug efflux system)
MFVHISQQVAESKNAVVVPAQSVMADVRGYYVFKVDGDKVGKVYVTLGSRSDNQAQIVSGLKAGDVVVTAGQQKLEDGSVIVVSPNAAFGVNPHEAA